MHQVGSREYLPSISVAARGRNNPVSQRPAAHFYPIIEDTLGRNRGKASKPYFE